MVKLMLRPARPVPPPPPRLHPHSTPRPSPILHLSYCTEYCRAEDLHAKRLTGNKAVKPPRHAAVNAQSYRAETGRIKS